MSEKENNNNQNENDFDEKMAIKFPDWDLLPPDLLIRKPDSDK